MFVTSHVFAGAALGAVIRRPVAGFAAGVASHLVMDALPHWGLPPGEDWLPYARKDGVIGLAAMATCAAAAPPRLRPGVIAGMIGGALPDMDKPGRHWFGGSPWPEIFDTFHAWLQRESPNRLRHEIAAAALLGVGAVGLLRRAR